LGRGLLLSSQPKWSKHTEQPHTEPEKNEQTNKTVNQPHAWQQHNPYNQDLSKAITLEKQNNITDEQQGPSSWQVMLLRMASQAKICNVSYSKEKTNEQ
jgi:hypothetical protein